MIDTGGVLNYQKDSWIQKNKEYNLMKNTLISFYKSIGLRKIDYLILTHGDYDHMGNAKILIDNFKVKEVIFNCGSFNDLENELINFLEEKNIKYFSCIDKINVNNTELTFLKTREYELV